MAGPALCLKYISQWQDKRADIVNISKRLKAELAADLGQVTAAVCPHIVSFRVGQV